jgi:hypothetical protein
MRGAFFVLGAAMVGYGLGYLQFGDFSATPKFVSGDTPRQSLPTTTEAAQKVESEAPQSPAKPLSREELQKLYGADSGELAFLLPTMSDSQKAAVGDLLISDLKRLRPDEVAPWRQEKHFLYSSLLLSEQKLADFFAMDHLPETDYRLLAGTFMDSFLKGGGSPDQLQPLIEEVENAERKSILWGEEIRSLSRYDSPERALAELIKLKRAGLIREASSANLVGIAVSAESKAAPIMGELVNQAAGDFDHFELGAFAASIAAMSSERAALELNHVESLELRRRLLDDVLGMVKLNRSPSSVIKFEEELRALVLFN